MQHRTPRLRRHLAGVASGALLILCGCGPGPPASSVPNVLFVLADDLRWDSVGSYGNPVVRTPHLDALAREGMVLDGFYVANPVCQASRAAFLTGLYTFQEGILRPPYRTLLAEGTPTVATHLASHGFVTGFVGKAHLGGDPRRWGFEHAPLYWPGAQVGDPPDVASLYFMEGSEVRIREDPTRRFADAAIAFIERHRRERWFLWLATTTPHAPHRYRPEHAYALDEIVRPPGYPPEAPFDPRRPWRGYYSQIALLDEQIGRVLARLDDLGLRDETLVLFTSDNGVMHGSHGIRTKGVWYEEVVRQPAIARWPGRIAPGSRSDALVSSVDVLPTVLELVGAPRPEALEGRSCLPVLLGQGPVRESVYAESTRTATDGGGSWLMARQGPFKYVRFSDRDESHLYDLDSDPHEEHDLVGSPQHGRVAAGLRAQLEAWRQGLR